MIELDKPFKKDRKGLWYIDSKDVHVEEMFVKQLSGGYNDHAHFFKIAGVDDYIIKDSTMYPLIFNRPRNLNLLKKLTDKQQEINNVDFPVAYYKSFNILKGIVIPYYPDSVSLGELIYIHPFNELINYYNHDSDEIDNLVTMLLNILELIANMYSKGVYYLDIHSGNFLIHNNDIKVIDFEPGYVVFKDKNDWYLKRILKNYELLVNKIQKKWQFKEINFYSGDSFYDAERNVKVLSKMLER